MPASQLNRVVDYIRRVAMLHDGKLLSDAQLLGHFIDNRDDAAFSTLVRRHGNMVLGVCQRILGNPHDAEDAFQATFLVLALKAGTIKPRQMVGNWLYGVAYQTAVRARSATAKRRRREKQVSNMAEPQANSQEIWNDLQPLLDQELSRLPDKYRVPIILCDLEGKSRKEAARQLGWPEGTVSGRLARGRAMLAKRLTRHGFTLTAGSLALTVAQHAASASMPGGLAVSTAKAALLVASGKAAAATALSATVAGLTKGVIQTMLISKLKSTAGVVLTMSLFAGVAGWGGGVVGLGRGAFVGPAEGGVDLALRQPKAEPDWMRIQGKWKIVSAERSGKALPLEDLNNTEVPLRFAFESQFIFIYLDNFKIPKVGEVPQTTIKRLELLTESEMIIATSKAFAAKDGNSNWVFHFNSMKAPKEVSFSLRLFGREMPSIHALFELTGDTLKLCWIEGAEENDRPKAISSTGQKQMMVVYQRQKDKTDKELLQGTWEAMSAQRFGEDLSAAQIKDIEELPYELEFSADKVKTKKKLKLLDPKAKGSADADDLRIRTALYYLVSRLATRFIVDPGKTPKEIDIGKTKAIYQLDGDTLKVCWFDPPIEGKRPTELSGKGKSQVLATYQKQKSDIDLLQGTWNAVSGERRGKKLNAAELREELEVPFELSFTAETAKAKIILKAIQINSQLVFQNQKLPAGAVEKREVFAMEAKVHGENVEAFAVHFQLGMGYKLDATKSPKKIDLSDFKAIYELDGDTLRICWNDPPAKDQRPKEMSGKAANQVLMVFQRQKAKTDQELLQGTWVAVSGQREGENVSAGDLRDHYGVPFELIFAADKVKASVKLKKPDIDPNKDSWFQFAFESLREQKRSMQERSGVAYKVNSAAKPKEIDFPRLVWGVSQGISAIYELDGDTLKLCWFERPIEGKRPKELSGKGKNQILVTYQKKKPDIELLQGKWIAVSAQRGAETIKGDAWREGSDGPFELEFVGENIKALAKLAPDPDPDRVKTMNGFIESVKREAQYRVQQSHGLSFKLNTSATPKELDSPWLVWGNAWGMQAIFELDGDTLRLCWNEADPKGTRPKEMSGKAPNQILVVFQRQAKTDKELLQGSWKAVSGQRFGENLTAMALAEYAKTRDGVPMELLFSASKVTVTKSKTSIEDQKDRIIAYFTRNITSPVQAGYSMKSEGSFAIDSQKEHKEIDILDWKAIYQLNGDSLMLCWYDPPIEGQRPTEFNGKGPNRFLVVFERQKPKSDQELLQGTWKVMSGHRVGDPVTAKDGEAVTRKDWLPVELGFRNNKVTAKRAKDFAWEVFSQNSQRMAKAGLVTPARAEADKARASVEGEFSINTLRMPKEIDLIELNAIYDVDGDTLRICFFDPPVKGERPKEMSGAGPNRFLVVYERQKEGEKPPEKKEQAQPPPPQEKTYEIDYSNMPWRLPLQWYGEVTGLAFTGKEYPTGTLSFHTPPGKRFTVNEITDAFNEILESQKLLLVRGPNSFTLISADQKLDPTLTPRVGIDELSKKAKSDLVSVVVPLKNIKAPKIIDGLKKALGPFDDAVALEPSNSILIQGRASTVAVVYGFIQDLEKGKK